MFRSLLLLYCQTVSWRNVFFLHSVNRLINLRGSFSPLWVNCLFCYKPTIGGRNHFGCKACKRTRMGHQCRRRLSSLFSKRRRWILCLRRHLSVHSICFYPIKYFKVLYMQLKSYSFRQLCECYWYHIQIHEIDGSLFLVLIRCKCTGSW